MTRRTRKQKPQKRRTVRNKRVREGPLFNSALRVATTVNKSVKQYSLKITGGDQGQFKIVYNGTTEITKHPQTLTANPIVQTAPAITYPSNLKSHVLLLTDPDAVQPEHLHWLVENGKPLLNYQGPRPPDQKVHRYIFKLYRKQKSQPLKVPTERAPFDSIQFEKDNRLLLLATRIFISSHQ